MLAERFRPSVPILLCGNGVWFDAHDVENGKVTRDLANVLRRVNTNKLINNIQYFSKCLFENRTLKTSVDMCVNHCTFRLWNLLFPRFFQNIFHALLLKKQFALNSSLLILTGNFVYLLPHNHSRITFHHCHSWVVQVSQQFRLQMSLNLNERSFFVNKLTALTVLSIGQRLKFKLHLGERL